MIKRILDLEHWQVLKFLIAITKQLQLSSKNKVVNEAKLKIID